MSEFRTTVYAVRIKNRDILLKSSSGGAFTAISDFFLRNGDAIICSVYRYELHKSEFFLITDKKWRDAALGSKYMQSAPGNIYRDALQWLKENPEKSVLFVGTGCQADSFRKYAEVMHVRDRVTVVDIICHGSPSPKLWREYAEMLEKKYGGHIEYLTFKDKRKGWNRPTAVVKINEKEISLDEYVKIFYNQCALRPACHECPYASFNRKTDLTIGDFWHIEDRLPDFYDPLGNSLLLIHTERGAKLFDEIKEEVEFQISSKEQCMQANLIRPTPISQRRFQFWKDYQKNGIDYIVRKFGQDSMKKKFANKCRHFWQLFNESR